MKLLSALILLLISIATFLYAGVVLQYGWNELLAFPELTYISSLAIITLFGLITSPATVVSSVNQNMLLAASAQAPGRFNETHRNWVIRLAYLFAVALSHLTLFFLTQF